jgi:RNA polymerase sigma-70 factor (ECF subfamily)
VDIDTNDIELMLSLKNGDIHAFDCLYKRHSDYLYRYLLRKCNDPGIAEDLSQEIWLKLFNTRERYNVYAEFVNYLTKIAKNHFIDYCRRNKNKLKTISVDGEEIEDSESEPGEEPENQVEWQQEYKAILECVSKLVDKQQEVFLLKEEAGFTVPEIADITGVNKETIKSRYRYAVDKLKTCLGRYE